MEKMIQDLVSSAIRLPSDSNGNPRYYIPVYMFTDAAEKFYRPKFATKYRGKKFGPGWIFQSYNLADDLRHSVQLVD